MAEFEPGWYAFDNLAAPVYMTHYQGKNFGWICAACYYGSAEQNRLCGDCPRLQNEALNGQAHRLMAENSYNSIDGALDHFGSVGYHDRHYNFEGLR